MIARNIAGILGAHFRMAVKKQQRSPADKRR
jgi:hypothetical protein